MDAPLAVMLMAAAEVANEATVDMLGAKLLSPG
jgi:hypothetical protein